MIPPSVRSRHARPAPAAVLAAVLLGACVGPSHVPPEEDNRLTREEFQQALEDGLIQPVDELADDDDFADAANAYDPDGLADASRVLPEAGLPASGEREPAQATFSENPYLAFGTRIKVHPDGTITKPFPLRFGTGAKMLNLLKEYGNFPIWEAAEGGPPSGVNDIKLDLIPEHDVELYQDLRDSTFPRVEPVPLADWLVVTTGEGLLHEVEDFINLFAAGVPQIEIEAKIVEISFTDTIDYGVESAGVENFGGGAFDEFSFKLPNVSPLGGVLAFGGIADGISYNATLQFLASNENVSIISQPKIAVREGGRADIINVQKIPFLKVNSLNPSGGVNASLDYITVGVQLYVVPRVVGTDTVALNIDIEASQQTGSVSIIQTTQATDPNDPNATPETSELLSPIVSTRSARTIVYLEPGQAVIMGGLISERNVDSERKIPFLGDIPILGYLFKSKFVQKEQTNVLFFIRPRILQGSDLNRQF